MSLIEAHLARLAVLSPDPIEAVRLDVQAIASRIPTEVSQALIKELARLVGELLISMPESP